MNTKRKSSFFVFLMVTLVFLSSAGYLKGEISTPKNKLSLNYLKQFGRDTVGVFSSPAHWKRNDFFTLAAVAGTGVLFFAFDQQIKEWVDSNNKGLFDEAAKY